MKIALIGTGYVGLTSGAGFADFGNDVTCADVNEARIAQLRDGKIPFHEPGLSVVVARNVAAKRLSFTTDIAEAVRGAEVIFLAVGTPQGDDGHADIRQVLRAAESVGRALSHDGAVIVTKSTVPVGTTEKMRQAVAGVTQRSFTVASNPEFLKEGDAVRDFARPDRVVIGADDDHARDTLRKLYGPFVRLPEAILCMSVRSAELTKYASNAMLATRISFMNEMANLCDKVGANVDDVRHGVGADARIGSAFLYAGASWGGSCYLKDIQALIATAGSAGVTSLVAQATLQANLNQREVFFRKIDRHFQENLRGRTIAVWGLSFKPETDDIRDAPALPLIEQLLHHGAMVRANDPAAIVNTLQAISGKLRDGTLVLPAPGAMTYCVDPYEAARGADALVLMTEWRAFRQPDWDRLKAEMRGDVLFDGRNVWDPQAARAAGFTYYGVGRS